MKNTNYIPLFKAQTTTKKKLGTIQYSLGTSNKYANCRKHAQQIKIYTLFKKKKNKKNN